MRFKVFSGLITGLFITLLCFSQPKPRQYTLWLKDKNASPYSLSKPLEFLSQRSIDRRTKQHFLLAETDLPVSPAYIKILHDDSLKILFTSRWLNTVTIETTDSLFKDKLPKYPFIENLQRVKRIGRVEQYEDFMASTLDPNDLTYGYAFDQIKIHNGEYLHKDGFQGQGMQIAVIDAGFFKVDSLYAFKYMRGRNAILGKWDFAEGNDSVYEDASHGMQVLSVIGGRLDTKIIGTAPEAGFYLLRSEVAKSEYPVEEFGWIAALEWADSAGADVVNSSLGYTQFQDSTLNHHYEDLDGKTVPASRAAGMAASKGMIVVNSAGNLGNNLWHFISVPADAKDILTVGAIDDKFRPGPFSSFGPTPDGRIKPDVVSRGVQTVVASLVDSHVTTVNGTSSAAPIITGLVACLWQEFPNKTSYEIMDAVRKSSNHYLHPHDQIGYGIPDFQLARQILREPDGSRVINVWPNPFRDGFTLQWYSSANESVIIFLSDALGRIVWHETLKAPDHYIHTDVINPPQSLANGVYILSVATSDKVLSQKIMKY
jgi:serine protease AprX